MAHPYSPVVQLRERSADHSGPHLDPALPGVQKVAAKNLAFGFLDLRLRMAMSIRIDQG